MKIYLYGVLLLIIFWTSNVFSKQNTDTVLMVSPETFRYNQETAQSNFFQKNETNISDKILVLHQFKEMQNVLKKNNIRIITLKNKKNTITPDAIFPNNWFSTHIINEKKNKKLLIIYPMLTKNRRLERQLENLVKVLEKRKIQFDKVIDLSKYEEKEMILEGTGSLVLDRENKITYAALSPRTDLNMVNLFSNLIGYKVISFHSEDQNKNLIYHTNVMMSVGSNFALIATENIPDKKELEKLIKEIKRTKKEIISITPTQMINMAGNVLELESTKKEKEIIMSSSAFNSLTIKQKKQLLQYGNIISVNIDAIEKIGGGSTRCMLAEIFH